MVPRLSASHVPPPVLRAVKTVEPLPPAPTYQYQSKQEKDTATKHYKELCSPTALLSMTPDEEQAVVREALQTDENLPKQSDLADAIGKKKSIPSLVRPRTYAESHPAFDLINHYANNGCPVDCGRDWTLDEIKAAIRRGAHPSADSREALEALHEETASKVKNKYSRVVRFGDLLKDLPPNLKISPVAMIPHKSRSFRTILDLSFRLRHKGSLLPSVNSATKLQAPAEAMVQLGNCIQRLVALMADNYDLDKPFNFAKLDIKDGFWRMAVDDVSAWNFCYVLPQFDPVENIEDELLVVPNCLQMGWRESPPFFCAASETARDVIDSLLHEINLPTHPFEEDMMKTAPSTDAMCRLTAAASYVNLTEVFVDDFIGATNNTDPDHLRHFSRAMLHGVHSIFPPPNVTGHSGEDPISQKKLHQGEGLWESTKEILGWLVNGANFTIQLMPEKCQKISKQIKEISKMRSCPLNQYQKLAGKLQHASFAIPGGKGLFSPIHRAMARNPAFIPITKELRLTLKDWNTLVQHLASIPTPVKLLVSEYPNFLEYTDACKLGAGGVITPGLEAIIYYVWQFPWPQDIQDDMITDQNPTGSLTINDLELAGLVLGWLVLEYVVGDLSFKHIGMFCDNTSAVSWAFKGHTTTSLAAARLLRLLAIRQRCRRASSLLPLSIAGKDNAMADIPSRAFKNGEFFHAQADLVSFFNSKFPLPQNQSWTEYRVPEKLASRVISCLRGEQLPMESLCKLPGLGKSIGARGRTTALNVASVTHTSQTCRSVNKRSFSQALQQECGPALSVEAIKSKFKRSRMRSRPSPRPANWLENQVPAPKQRENTFYP